jgi:hypothetical protein
MSTLHLCIICFTVAICVAMITSTIDKAVVSYKANKNKHD